MKPKLLPQSTRQIALEMIEQLGRQLGQTWTSEQKRLAAGTLAAYCMGIYRDGVAHGFVRGRKERSARGKT